MKKRILTVVLAIAIVCSIVSIMGTLAYLTKQSNGGKAIVNTFTASDGLVDEPTVDKPNNGFFIEETDIKDASKDTTTGNAYTVLPGVDLDKDATVRVTGKTKVDSYVFVEALDENMEGSGLSYTVKADWKDLKMKGAKGGNLYVYKKTIAEDLSAEILVDNKVTVSKDYNSTKVASVSFCGYMCQEASFEAEDNTDAEFLKAAAKAYTECFLTK